MQGAQSSNIAKVGEKKQKLTKAGNYFLALYIYSSQQGVNR